jgi:hypothetical protein
VVRGSDQNVEIGAIPDGWSTFWLLYDQNVDPGARSPEQSTFWSLVVRKTSRSAPRRRAGRRLAAVGRRTSIAA